MTILASCGHPVSDEELLDNVFFCRDDDGKLYSVLLCGKCTDQFIQLKEFKVEDLELKITVT